MLEQDVNDITKSTETADATEVAVAETNAVAIQAGSPLDALINKNSPFAKLKHVFLEHLGTYLPPQDATTSCTIIGSSIMFGSDMEQDAGDFLVVQPVNLTPYSKVRLGIERPSDEEKRMQVNCYDGNTVTYNDETYTKDEFMELLHAKGYSKAAWQEQAVLHAMYVDCDRADKVKVGEDDKLFAIYLSKSSFKAWNSFLFKSGMGTTTSPLLKLGKERREWNGVTWHQFTFSRYEG